VLVKPTHPSAKLVMASMQTISRQLRKRIDIFEANTDAEIEKAYAALKAGTPLIVATDPFFFSRREQLVALAARHSVPAIYDSREFAQAGGLLSYGPDHVALWRQAGGYVARILKGAKPADLPVTQASLFDFVINQKTAKSLGLVIPPTLLTRADEVIG
jgi:putative ABC transport system substrate-binding protein